jgi:hypothetical protein
MKKLNNVRRGTGLLSFYVRNVANAVPTARLGDVVHDSREERRQRRAPPRVGDVVHSARCDRAPPCGPS